MNQPEARSPRIGSKKTAALLALPMLAATAAPSALSFVKSAPVFEFQLFATHLSFRL